MTVEASQRLDAWLWCARVLRQRTQCAALAASGAIRVNRNPATKPHMPVRPGDILTLPIGGRVRVLEVLSLGLRRGPPEAARLLYREIPEPAASCPPAPPAPYPAPSPIAPNPIAGSRR